MPEVQLLTWNPGHFHAALVQKETIPGVSPIVHVYAPLGPDLLAHLARIASFNARAENPTLWQLEVHTGSDSLPRLLAERRGNVVIISGRNRGKIDAILASLQAGLHVLADKPWVIDPVDLPTLSRALEVARSSRLVAMDIMTERFEITTQLQRALVHDPEVFGDLVSGTPDRPTVWLESEHFLSKTVAGVRLQRPTWFFDVFQQGEGLSDVGTHLVDLVSWVLFPNIPLKPSDVELLRARRVPTVIGRPHFQKMTGEANFPDFLQPNLSSGQLLYYCNTLVSYLLRGIHVYLNVAWGYEAGPRQGDRHLAIFRGTKSRIEARQGEAEFFRPEVYVVPHDGVTPEHTAAIDKFLAREEQRFPGVSFEGLGKEYRFEIPERLRSGHEAHFSEVTRLFLDYLKDPSCIPLWEDANMLVKYHITTHGVDLARRS